MRFHPAPEFADLSPTPDATGERGLDRRQWLAGAAAATGGLGVVDLGVGRLQLPTMGSVVLFLNGGNDAANTVVPIDPHTHRHYARARGALALDRGALLELGAVDDAGQALGVHPACRHLAAALRTGRAQTWLNIGLREPMLHCHHRASEQWRLKLSATATRPITPHPLATPETVLAACAEPTTALWLDLDGFDFHHDLLARHRAAWARLDAWLGRWLTLTADLSHPPALTIASEFGRAARPRGTGADHGWGGHLFHIAPTERAVYGALSLDDATAPDPIPALAR